MSTQLLGLVVLVLGGLWKAWPLIKDKIPSMQPKGEDSEAMQALAAAQKLYGFMSRRPGCKKGLQALNELTMGNFMPALAPSANPAGPPAGGGEQAVRVVQYNITRTQAPVPGGEVVVDTVKPAPPAESPPVPQPTPAT